MWDKKSISLGAVQAKSKNVVLFTYKSDTPVKIENISTPCSCTSATWNDTTQTLIVVYEPKHVPNHIKNQLKQSSYNDLKTVSFDLIEINNISKKDMVNISAQVFDSLPQHLNK